MIILDLLPKNVKEEKTNFVFNIFNYSFFEFCIS